MLGPCYLLSQWFLVSSFVKKSFYWRRESWLLYFNYALAQSLCVGEQSVIVTYHGHTHFLMPTYLRKLFNEIIVPPNINLMVTVILESEVLPILVQAKQIVELLNAIKAMANAYILSLFIV